MISASAPRAARERGAAMRISLCTTRTPSPLRAILTMRSRSPAAGASPVSSTIPLVLATSMRVRALSSSSRWTASPMAASMALSSTSGESSAALMSTHSPPPPRASVNIITNHSGPICFIVCITQVLSSTFHLEGVFDPVRRASVAFGHERDHIETGRPTRGVMMALQVMRCRRCELGLFAAVDRFRSAGKERVGAVAHFDEYHGVAVVHDEVNLSVAATVIAFAENQAMGLQIAAGPRFLLLTFDAGRVRAHGIGVGTAGRGAGSPLLRRAHNKVRRARCRHQARREPIGSDAQRIQPLQAGLLGPRLFDRCTQRIGVLVEQPGHVGKQDAVEVAVFAGIGDTVVNM